MVTKAKVEGREKPSPGSMGLPSRPGIRSYLGRRTGVKPQGLEAVGHGRAMVVLSDRSGWPEQQTMGITWLRLDGAERCRQMRGQEVGRLPESRGEASVCAGLSWPSWPPGGRVHYTCSGLLALQGCSDSPRVKEPAAQSAPPSCLLNPACLGVEDAGTTGGLGFTLLRAHSTLPGERCQRLHSCHPGN